MTGSLRSHGPWVIVGLLGAIGFAMVASARGEHINALWIVIAAISFGGYIAVRVLGDRLGVLAASIAGGLASSTATTLTLAEPAVAAVLAVLVVGERLRLLGWLGIGGIGLLLLVLALAPSGREVEPPAVPDVVTTA